MRQMNCIIRFDHKSGLGEKKKSLGSFYDKVPGDAAGKQLLHFIWNKNIGQEDFLITLPRLSLPIFLNSVIWALPWCENIVPVNIRKIKTIYRIN